MSYKGKFVPVNRQKYRGNVNNIEYRSSWELYLMRKLDKDPDVVWWNSEECIIPYFSSAEGRKRRYFVDFTVKYTNGETFLYEVKPMKETQPPIKPSKLTAKNKQRFMQEHLTYCVNIDKWKAACTLSEKKGWKFKIVTEKTLKAWGMPL